MPNRDGTGRLGRGKNCDEVAQSDRMGRGQGRGFGRLVKEWFGRGLGFRHRRGQNNG